MRESSVVLGHFAQCRLAKETGGKFLIITKFNTENGEAANGVAYDLKDLQGYLPSLESLSSYDSELQNSLFRETICELAKASVSSEKGYLNESFEIPNYA